MQTIEQSGRVNTAFERLEPYDGKLSRTVLRGLGGGNTPWLPGVITMAELQGEAADKTQEAKPYRAFVCQTINPYGYPAKDRSGRLECVEEPHLGRLMDKIRNQAPGARLQVSATCQEQACTRMSGEEQPSTPEGDSTNG